MLRSFLVLRHRFTTSAVRTIAVILWFAASTNTIRADDAKSPNVVFILADDLGINDLSCYGRKDQPTPHLDQLAKRGMRFTSSYCAQPICSPSRAALMTGLTPARLNLTTYLPGRPDAPSQKVLHPKIDQQLPLRHKTIAEHFKAAGYATACVGKWHLGGKGFLPEDQGFDFVHVGTANTTPSEVEGGKGEYDLTAQASKFIEANKDKPFFLYIPHNNPHIPLAAASDRIAKHPDAFNPLYAAVVETLDDSVGRLLAKLDALKLSDDTIVVFTSDNGGLHVLEGGQTPATHNTPFRAGKGFLYEGGLRVPTIVRWPGRVAADTISDVPFVNTDWLPTLLEMCGLPAAKDIDGVSIAPLLAGKMVPEREFYWHFPHYTNQGGRPGGAMRSGQWKWIEYYDEGEIELFDLKTDPGEAANLAENQPALARSMRVRFVAWRKHVGARLNTPNPDFDPALFQKLYRDTDVSTLKAGPSAAAMRPKLDEWRKGMNAVLPKKP